jgi:hypothetical protein
MRLSVATNWDDRLIEGVEGYPVQDFFGTLQFDPVGGGRPSSILTEISERRKVEEYVEKLHAKGIKFNYIMSGACMGGREYDPQWNKGLFEFLDWLRDFCDYMTVSVPYLAEVIKTPFSGDKAHRFGNRPCEFPKSNKTLGGTRGGYHYPGLHDKSRL